MVENVYIVDTSSFIKIKPKNYPFDIYVSMWENLEKLVKEKRIISHIKVFRELESYEGKKDEIFKWAKNHRDIFKNLTEEQIEIAKRIVNTNNFKCLMNNTKPLTGDTDVFVISLAMEKPKQITLTQLNIKRIVVCEEILKDNKINIPFVCKHFNIECINIFDMFRKEGWKW